mgnify:CR=1 FL=1
MCKLKKTINMMIIFNMISLSSLALLTSWNAFSEEISWNTFTAPTFFSEFDLSNLIWNPEYRAVEYRADQKLTRTWLIPDTIGPQGTQGINKCVYIIQLTVENKDSLPEDQKKAIQLTEDWQQAFKYTFHVDTRKHNVSDCCHFPPLDNMCYRATFYLFNSDCHNGTLEMILPAFNDNLLRMFWGLHIFINDKHHGEFFMFKLNLNLPEKLKNKNNIYIYRALQRQSKLQHKKDEL